MKTKIINKSQRNAINRIIRFYRKKEAYNKVTSIRIELDDSVGILSLVVRTKRSDCDQFSPRQLLCENYGHYLIGARGKIKVCTATSGIDTNDKPHVATMLNCSYT